MRSIFLLVLCSFSAIAFGYENPVVDTDAPDPGVLKMENGHYVATTTSGDAPDAFPIRTSPNLVDWTLHSHVFPSNSTGRPKWGIQDFWAAEIHKINAERHVVYYAARDTTKTLCVGAAVSTSGPLGPFNDIGHPLVRQENMGSIDPTYFYDSSTHTHWLLYKDDGNAIGKPTYINIWQLEDDGVTLVGQPRQLFRNDLSWEGTLVEAPWMIWREPYYYIFYSANGFYSVKYDVAAARSKNITGPYEKHTSGPVLFSDGKHFAGPGHCSVIEVAKDDWYVVYHAYTGAEPNSKGRKMLTDHVVFTSDGWITMGVDGHPSWKSEPTP